MSAKKQITEISNSNSDYVKYFSIAIFVIAVILNLNYSFTGIHNYLLENHAFRQTQTALTAYYFWKDGFKLAYETPVVGAPWAIPFEFPLYQWIVAELKSMTNGNMDYIGRVVSLLFFYLSLCYVFLITNKYVKNTFHSLFLLSFILLHPTYIFWSRTFMIESTALFFCLMYLYHFLVYHDDNKKYTHLIFTVLAGTLAALVKVTTLMPIIIFLFLMIIWAWYKGKGYTLNVKLNLKYVFYGLTMFLIPVIAIKLWTDYTDHIRSLNEYAYGFTSTSGLGSWNFGTMDQKTSAETWKNIGQLSQVSNSLFYLSIIGISIWAYVSKLTYYKQALACFFLYALAPIIFTNLHFIHDYYTYSNSIFLASGIGFLALSLLQNGKDVIKIIGAVYAISILYFFMGRYKEGYYKVQTSHPNYVINTCNLVKQNTKPDDVILVYGNDWGSEYAYYSERRTIALRNTFKSVKDTAFVKLMDQNKDYNVNTLVFVSYTGLFDNNFANELINHMGMKPLLQQEPFFVFKK